MDLRTTLILTSPVGNDHVTKYKTGSAFFVRHNFYTFTYIYYVYYADFVKEIFIIF